MAASASARRHVPAPRAPGGRPRARRSTPPGTGPRSAWRAGARRSTPAIAIGISASARQPQWRGEAHRSCRPRSAASPRRSRASTWSTRRRRSSRATASRRSCSSSANRSRTRRREVSTSTRAPVSGSTSARCPTAGSSASRGSTISTASTEWRTRSDPERPLPARWSRKSRDHDHEPGLARQPSHPAERAGQRLRVVLAVGCDALGEQSAAARRSRAWRRAAGASARRRRAERDQADAAGAPHAEASEHERHALGDVGLQPPGGAERHRRRDVEHDPGRQRALGHVQADVRLAGAGGRGRVDVADVVADLVRAQLCELHADADARRAPVAGQHPRHEPA